MLSFRIKSSPLPAAFHAYTYMIVLAGERHVPPSTLTPTPTSPPLLFFSPIYLHPPLLPLCPPPFLPTLPSLSFSLYKSVYPIAFFFVSSTAAPYYFNCSFLSKYPQTPKRSLFFLYNQLLKGFHRHGKAELKAVLAELLHNSRE